MPENTRIDNIEIALTKTEIIQKEMCGLILLFKSPVCNKNICIARDIFGPIISPCDAKQ